MKNILITGGNDGMGRATALLLAGSGSHLILMGRNQQRGEATERDVVSAGGSAKFLRVDLSTRRGLLHAATQVEGLITRLDAIVHAAGGVFSKRRVLTEDGVEQTFAIQVLARFVLTERLHGHLRAAQAPKVVAIAGGGSFGKSLDLTDLQGERSHSHFGSIRKTALANDLLTLEQMDRHEGIAFFNYGPGLVRSKVTMWHPLMRVMLNSLGRLFSRSPEEAAVDLAGLLTGEHSPGFYGPALKYNGPLPAIDEPGLSQRLWDYGAALMTGLRQETP
jgi:NAD(P)-dependent dehydrogenase (short-subunit alcohol dehydrogenase family)